MTQIQFFAARALRQLPAALWWVLGTLLCATLSLTLRKEVLPNTPAAAAVANWVVVGCGLLLPPLGVWWLWHVAALIEHPGWRLLWRAGTTRGTLLLLLLVVILGLLGLGVVVGL